ncbi:MAG TPA: DNA repair protein RecN [Acidimicrobiales bacterium]|nr:DNA repair protein RecN [Acidimicrobiales bacterium]
MLTELHVRDLGVIEDLSLAFGPGMTALTGETGAGKTLLVEALHLLLGGRPAPGLVRGGAAEAFVEARFVMEARGGTEREIVVARALPASGRSRAWVDGRMAPIAALAELAPSLVDIHGQHEHQSLRDPAEQVRVLDAFAGCDPASVVEARRRLRSARDRLERLGGDERQRAREADVLRHQLAEIAAAGLADPGEDDLLAVEEHCLADLAAHVAAAASALGALDPEPGDGHEVAGALAAVAGAAGALAGRPGLDELSGRLRSVHAELADVASEVRRVVDTWEQDPERLRAVQERRRVLADLRRKYGATLADVLAFGAAARARLDELEDTDAAAARVRAEIAAAEEDLAGLEGALREARRAAAPRLGAAVAARLAALAMPGARLEVAVGGEGAGEPVRFLLGANPGEPVQPLHHVASGGELARAMLALRLEVAGGPATMVFDEVDAGVGGEAALALARALREVAAGRQVLVVTHLPQVAAFADHQVAVRKQARSGRTVTTAVVLGEDERTYELARMLSGHPGSATARAHASELLALRRASGDGRAQRVGAGRR